MDTQEIAQWMRDEHARVHELANELREQVAVVPRANLGKWIADVREQYEHFRAHLIKHMALEERDGYLPSVTERRPTLAGEVERLKHEHVETIKIMDGIHEAVHQLTVEDRLLIRDCRDRIGDLLSYIEHHEEEEDLLITHVFTRDIGTAD